MILFRGVPYDLKYRSERDRLIDRIADIMKSEHTYKSAVSNMINKLIDEGNERELVKLEQDDIAGLEFKLIDREMILENVLKQLGYDFDKSWNSRSVYAYNDNGERVRISNHYNKRNNSRKRILKYGQRDVANLIFGKGIVDGAKLVQNGFTRVNPEQEFYLY